MWTRNYGALGQTARVCFGVLCANRTREVKRDFKDLPIRMSEGRVVNTPLVFKRVLLEKKEDRRKGQRKKDKRVRERKRTRESGRENGRKEEERRKRERGDGKRVGKSESDARLEWKKGLSPEIGVKKTMNAGGVEYGNRN
ncbi:hypothetical protein TNCV_1705661 [Trichonephila clavipes]|uniref:Uncharacterized protein n=1 Tax=Trichonephila clavipes TaxID=2585209 RepID=A0A8X6R4N0_TRICX|nr:hypothetical protein TNCV_1705661 [Trichonephila clavipes]